ncbi:hypothetical protein [Galbitalea soli]|uniref:hypothetical protein n=1 Tax=Galbitalea soli TaxID=1268042 RepID=UPI00157534DC|nr:hypothetical protein [Galbitalea soli]NYJ30327.1 hypothetical protein [Galbitalea soli]
MNVFAFIIAFLFFVGGIALFGFSFETGSAEAIVFLAGLAAIIISLAIPFHILKRTDR